MIKLSTEERTELVCTADEDVKIKKRKPLRMVPVAEVEINGGIPLSFVVRTLNSREQLTVASMVSGHDNVSPMLASLDLAVLEIKGEGFHHKDRDKVSETLKRVPPSVLSALGEWVIDQSWGADPLSKQK